MGLVVTDGLYSPPPVVFSHHTHELSKLPWPASKQPSNATCSSTTLIIPVIAVVRDPLLRSVVGAAETHRFVAFAFHAK
jgi:hypothetical protein